VQKSNQFNFLSINKFIFEQHRQFIERTTQDELNRISNRKVSEKLFESVRLKRIIFQQSYKKSVHLWFVHIWNTSNTQYIKYRKFVRILNPIVNVPLFEDQVRISWVNNNGFRTGFWKSTALNILSSLMENVATTATNECALYSSPQTSRYLRILWCEWVKESTGSFTRWLPPWTSCVKRAAKIQTHT